MKNEANFGRSRRVFFERGALVIAAATWNGPGWLAAAEEKALRVGLVTDLHYADKPPRGTRHYRESLSKLDEAAEKFSASEIDVLVELGDLIDAADSVDVELGYLNTINRQFAPICDDRHYVLGNHCVDTLHKEEFLDRVEREHSYYAFDRGPYRFLALDACFRHDGQPYGRRNFEWTDANIPPAELEWLAAELTASDKPAIVLAHQRLDVSNNHGVKNNAQVREILQDFGKVSLVLQGHSHQNDLREIEGIPYCTLVAMVEGSGQTNNGYAVMEIDSAGTIRLEGFRQQHSQGWTAPG